MVRSLTAGLVAVALAACVDDAGDGAVRIIRNLAVSDEACVVSSQLTATGRSGGAIESTAPIDYVLTPVVQNFATSSGGKLTAQRTAFIEGARIDLTFSKPDLFTAEELTTHAALVKFASPFSAAVSPDGGTAGVGFSVIPIELLKLIQPKLTSAMPRVTVNVRLKLYGKMGGGSFESEPFLYPVNVCDYRIGACVIAPAFVCGATLPEGQIVRKGNPCNPYQDGPTDCCTQGTTLTCPGFAGGI